MQYTITVTLLAVSAGLLPFAGPGGNRNCAFFSSAQFGPTSLILNKKVGSTASHSFPKLRKNFPLLLT
jgi:hypothetical protein